MLIRQDTHVGLLCEHGLQRKRAALQAHPLTDPVSGQAVAKLAAPKTAKKWNIIMKRSGKRRPETSGSFRPANSSAGP